MTNFSAKNHVVFEDEGVYDDDALPPIPWHLYLGDRGKRKGIWSYYATLTSSHKGQAWNPGLRCMFDGVHKASLNSHKTVTHTEWMGKGRPYHLIDQRNGLTEASPGDNSYQVSEYSRGFHHLGSTRPLVKYDIKRTVRSIDLPVPLQSLTVDHNECFREKEKRRQRAEDAEDVRNLENWKPATPLPLTIPVLEESISGKLSLVDLKKQQSTRSSFGKQLDSSGPDDLSCDRTTSSAFPRSGSSFSKPSESSADTDARTASWNQSEVGSVRG